MDDEVTKGLAAGTAEAGRALALDDRRGAEELVEDEELVEEIFIDGICGVY